MKIHRLFFIKAFTATVILSVWLATAPAAVLAHKVSIFAWVESGTVHTLSKFSGGKKVKNGRVTVYAEKGGRLLEGLTNDQGEFSFKIPQKTALRVELIAGAGHKGSWTLPLAEITGAPADASANTDRIPSTEKALDNPRISGVSGDQLQIAIEKALDRKLKPVIKLLAESQQKGPSLSEILGGIGYIIGLVGLAAYFKRRQKQ